MDAVTILLNDFDEYEVPTGGENYWGSVYYTPDRLDAVATAKAAHGWDVRISFTTGSYAYSDE